MKARLLVILVLSVACGACYGSNESTPATSGSATSGSPEFDNGTVLIDTEGESVLMHVLVAENEEQHAYGLMNRESLPQDEGMVFLFFEPRELGFWMKDTLIPLSVAFFDGDGRILEILDMEPCPPDEVVCPTYDPGVTYMGALEVNRGAFERLGVAEGDVIEVVPGSE
jgi:uncharacterized membrane protein (UPF0127 family)